MGWGNENLVILHVPYDADQACYRFLHGYRVSNVVNELGH